MAIKTMMAKEYAKLRGISIQCVCKALRKGDLSSKSLSGIKSFITYGRMYQLRVDLEKV